MRAHLHLRSYYRLAGEAALHIYLATRQVTQQACTGLAPVTAWQCPLSQTIKGNHTIYSGEWCLFCPPAAIFISGPSLKGLT